MQTHNELEPLATGYVFGTLNPEERQAFEEHLSSCDSCTLRVAEIKAIAHLLPLAVEEKAPPPQLKQRLFAVVNAEMFAPQKAEELRQPSFFDKLRQVLTNRAIAAFSTTLLIFAIAGLAVWNVSIQNTNVDLKNTMETDQATLARSFRAITILSQADMWWPITGTEAAPNATGALAHSSQLSESCLVVSGLPEPKENYYQGWAVKDGVPSSTGNLWTMDSSKWRVISGDMEDMDTFLVTMESQKGLSQPKGPVVIQVPLASQP